MRGEQRTAKSEQRSAAGLTTTRAPFIERARSDGRLYIHQPYELYNEENQEAWRQLYRRIRPRWEQYATRRFLDGVDNVALNPDQVPRLEDINRFLKPLSGFIAKAVSGYIPAFQFFDCLRQSEFPTTITIRGLDSLDYLPEPDIFHDVAGHVPMHTDLHFAKVLVRFGDTCRLAAEMAAEMPAASRLAWMESALRAMTRFFWFTIEFGLMREAGRLKVYGSGLLSSYGEIANGVEADVDRRPFDLAEVVNQPFDIDHFQPVLYVVDSFEHLFSEVDRLRRWLREGKLDAVAGGKPDVAGEDLESFLTPDGGR